ncbi:MAG: hypothetical protein M1827_004116 [Pycnora praestabilis]|nr:MAG: hypothetical protein M1827_004116 [Pycnora praestabilis]
MALPSAPGVPKVLPCWTCAVGVMLRKNLCPAQGRPDGEHPTGFSPVYTSFPSLLSRPAAASSTSARANNPSSTISHTGSARTPPAQTPTRAPARAPDPTAHFRVHSYPNELIIFTSDPATNPTDEEFERNLREFQAWRENYWTG